ncbi:MAG: hypothetical protein ACOYMS_07330 [Terrimicrobiaceae bacterium]
MKKLLLSSLTVFLLTCAGALAQSTTEKVETKTEEAVAATESTVKKAAKKTGAAVENAAEKTGTAVKKTADATATGAKKAAKTTADAAKKAATATGKAAKKVATDVTNSEIYKKVETELGKPFTPEQQQKYAEAWKAAQAKARAAEKEFSEKVSEITGIGKKKTTTIVKENGL